MRGRNATVTGGGSGIGRAICLRLAEEGCAVGVFDMNLDGADETVAKIAQSGGRASAHRVDITDFAAVKAGVVACERAQGPTDILVNNAGWDKIVPLLQTDLPAHKG